jgi:hypothetical protein
MPNFKLVITGDVPHGKAHEFHESIPDLVRGMRSFGITVNTATSFPGGIAHHTHERAQLDAPELAPEIADPASRDRSTEVYIKMLEDELSKLATGVIERFPGEHPNDGTSIVDTALAILDGHADTRARLAAATVAPPVEMPLEALSHAYTLNVVRPEALRVGDVVLALNGVIWHRPRRLDAIDANAERTLVTYRSSNNEPITTPYDPDGMWFVARVEPLPAPPADGVYGFAELGKAIAGAADNVDTITSIDGAKTMLPPSESPFETVTPPVK